MDRTGRPFPVRPLSGSWMDFFHWPGEGLYFSDTLRTFDAGQWQAKVREMASLGMTYVVLTGTAVVRPGREEAYFRTDLLPFPEDYRCPDPIGAVLEEADRQDMKVFVSCGWYGNMQRPWENMQSKEVTRKAFRAMEQLYALYGSHPSFYGWYLPDETAISETYEPFFIDYVNRYADFGKSVFPDGMMLIAPYGTRTVRVCDAYLKQLDELRCDLIAYQDEVGVRKTTPEESERSFAALKEMHDRVGKARLWADIELFDFEGEVYRSPLIPAETSRLAKQLAAAGPYAEDLLCYCYPGILNLPGTEAFCGRADSARYGAAYAALIGRAPAERKD